MSAACPKCQSKLPLEASQINEDGAISCPACQVRLKVEISVEVINGFEEALIPDNGAAMPVVASSDDRSKVLLCIDGEGTRDLIKEILIESRFSVVDVPSGKEAFSAIREHRPAITMIDMGLSDVVGTELCSEIKSDPELGQTAVVLVASMYDKSSTQHEPDSLVGADDYIDRRRIQSGLLEKFENLLVRDEKVDEEETPMAAMVEEDVAPTAVEPEINLGASDPLSDAAPVEEDVAPIAGEPEINLGESDLLSDAAPVEEDVAPIAVEPEINLGESDPVSDAASVEEDVAPIAVEPEINLGESDPVSDAETFEPISDKEPDLAQAPPPVLEEESAEQKDAKRLARIIVSDIALYNPKKVDEGIQNDTFFDLLEEEIEEGKQHYLTRVSEILAQPMIYLDEAFEDYINKRKSSLS